MKIVCPSCAATYEVPDSVVAAKRAVRCARCGGDWVPGAGEASPAAPSADAAPIPPAPLAPPHAPVPLPEPEPEPEPEPVAEAAPVAEEPPVSSQKPSPFVREPPPIIWETPGPGSVAPPPVAPPPPAPAPPPPSLGGTKWQSVAEALAAEAAAIPPPATNVKTPVTAWVASVALLAILLLASVAFREPLMKAWPASTRLYAALGLYRP